MSTICRCNWSDSIDLTQNKRGKNCFGFRVVGMYKRSKENWGIFPIICRESPANCRQRCCVLTLTCSLMTAMEWNVWTKLIMDFEELLHQRAATSPPNRKTNTKQLKRNGDKNDKIEILPFLIHVKLLYRNYFGIRVKIVEFQFNFLK